MANDWGFGQMMKNFEVQAAYPQTVHLIAVGLFFLECYHVIGHTAILFRLRMLPRKDLVRIRYYFLVDALTVFTVSFIYTGRFRWLATLQIIQHMFFFLTWNKNKYTRKVISWSSLDWTNTSETKKRWEWDVISGTAFDVCVHLLNAYILSQFLSLVEVAVGCAMVSGASLLVLFSPRFAWSSPASVPSWVKRRIEPVNMKEVNESSLF